MRLTVDQVTIIKEAAVNNFGPGSKVYLFGSRVDDTKKGGDIDLLVIADFSPQEMFAGKLNMLTELHSGLGERKIDIITYNMAAEEEPVPLIVKEALSTGVEL